MCIRDRVHQGIIDLGLSGLVVPEEYGGLELNMLFATVVSAALGSGTAPVPYVGSYVMAPLAINLGGEENQKNQWLPKIAGGECVIGVGLSEYVGAREDAGIEFVNGKLSGRCLFIFPFVKGSMSIKTVYIASFLGYATHGLLDACTSYGTLLFWPFSNERITWNNISIVDPIFTIPILILIAITILTRKKIFSFFAIGWIILYLSFGFFQYERALSAAIQLANSRGHNAERMTLKPSFGNLILWKSIYQYEEAFYVDAIRSAQTTTWCLGETIKIFNCLLYTSPSPRD